jgi:hypothetical protein
MRRWGTPPMGIEQHFMTLREVRHQPEGAGGCELAVRHVQAPAQAADLGILAAPVKLEGFSMGKRQRNEGAAGRCIADLLLQFVHTDRHPRIAAGITLRPDGFEHHFGSAPVPLGAVVVGLHPLALLISIRIDDAGGRPFGVFRLSHFRLTQPLPYRATAECLHEHYNRTVRYEWLAHYLFDSIEEVQNYATRWLWTYHHERPNLAIGGITPKHKLALAA